MQPLRLPPTGQGQALPLHWDTVGTCKSLFTNSLGANARMDCRKKNFLDSLRITKISSPLTGEVRVRVRRPLTLTLSREGREDYELLLVKRIGGEIGIFHILKKHALRIV